MQSGTGLCVVLGLVLGLAPLGVRAEEDRAGGAAALTSAVEEKFSAVEKEIEKLREAGKTARAEALAKEVSRLRERAKTTVAVFKRDEPTLHVAGLYEGDVANGPKKFGA